MYRLMWLETFKHVHACKRMQMYADGQLKTLTAPDIVPGAMAFCPFALLGLYTPTTLDILTMTMPP